jgi:hypothetical protein
LIQVLVGSEERILHRIFGVSRIAQKPISDTVKIREAV